MSLELIFQISLVLSTFFCALVAGFLFAFAIVVMPGIGKLDDREFIKAFQVMDGIIQNNQPIFLLVWIGSFVFMIVSAITGYWILNSDHYKIIAIDALIFTFGVHISTVIKNIPLNNNLQKIDVENSSLEELKQARADFEPRWNKWNNSRTVLACIIAASLIILLCAT